MLLTTFFCFLEVIEISGLSDGVFELSDIVDYVTNVWNFMDWLNYLIFFFAFGTFQKVIRLENSEHPCALLCQTVGYQDEWEMYYTVKQPGTSSACACASSS